MNLLKLAAVFASSFACFLAVGAVAGWKQREQNARAVFLGHISVVDRDRAPRLWYGCRGGPHMSYDLATNRASFASVQDAARTPLQLPINPSALQDVASAVVGGTTGGWTIVKVRQLMLDAKAADKLEAVGERKFVRVLVAVAGAVTGFALGYRWAAIPTCDASVTVEFAKKLASWKEAKRVFLITELHSMEERMDHRFAQRIQEATSSGAEPTWSSLNASYVDLMERARGVDFDPTQQDFSTYLSLARIVRRAGTGPG